MHLFNLFSICIIPSSNHSLGNLATESSTAFFFSHPCGGFPSEAPSMDQRDGSHWKPGLECMGEWGRSCHFSFFYCVHGGLGILNPCVILQDRGHRFQGSRLWTNSRKLLQYSALTFFEVGNNPCESHLHHPRRRSLAISKLMGLVWHEQVASHCTSSTAWEGNKKSCERFNGQISKKLFD